MLPLILINMANNNHYYNNNSNLKSDQRILKYTFKQETISYFTDNGTFSKDHIDFGTNVLLNSIEVEGKTICDVGCGCGIIGLSIGKKYKDSLVTMVDVNDRCISLTNKSIEYNKLPNCKCIKSSLYENLKDEMFDMIISNPPIRAGKEIVHGVISDGFNHLNDGGSIWVVIQKKQGAPSMEKKMLEVFGNCETVNKEKGYYIFKSTKH